MRSRIKVIMVGFILCGVIGYIVGPARMYGWIFAKELTAKVVEIRSFTQDGKDNAESFAIEFHSDDGKIYVATSCKRIWAVVAKGDLVCAKLYPAPPWSSSGGSWINATLVNKMIKPKK